MSAKVSYIPAGYTTVTAYLLVDDMPKLLDFLKRSFDAELIQSHEQPDGTIGHAEIRIGSSMIMAAQARPEWPAQTASFYLYVPDTDATYARAIAAGAVSLMEPSDQFYGDRNAGVKDASGNQWWIGTHIEDVSPDEIQRRYSEARKAS